MSAKQLYFEAIGTHWEIDITTPVSATRLRSLRSKIEYRAELFDKTYSRFRADSLLSKLASEGGSVILPDDAQILIAFYMKLYEFTGGKVTPLIGNTISDAGYDANYSLIPKSRLRTAPAWESIIDFEYPVLSLRKPTILDVGAAGKGYLVDIIYELLLAEGIDDFIVDASGDMRHSSPNNSQQLRVGLEHPRDASLAIGVALINNQSICGSADNRRRWGDMHHIIDPDTAQPTSDIIATWVIADQCMVADGLATALFFTLGKTLQKDFEFEYCLVRSDLSFEVSAAFPAELFSEVLA